MEKTFATLPGESTISGADDYNYLGTRALAEGLAARGGFGIAAHDCPPPSRRTKVRGRTGYRREKARPSEPLKFLQPLPIERDEGPEALRSASRGGNTIKVF